jgi:hypothetical protein
VAGSARASFKFSARVTSIVAWNRHFETNHDGASWDHPKEEHMLLYKFGAGVGSRVALTKDKTGSNLPEDGRPWKALGTTRAEASTSDIGADCAHVIAAVEKHGFFVFPTSQTKPSTV